MSVNALERIALLRDLASEIIAEIELLPTPNPNLLRLRADLINSDKLHIRESWEEEIILRYAYYCSSTMMNCVLGGTTRHIIPRSPRIRITNTSRGKKASKSPKKQNWKMC